MNGVDGDLYETVGRIEAKVDVLIDRTASHDTRLRTVERKQWVTSGGIALAVALVWPKVRALFGF